MVSVRRITVTGCILDFIASIFTAVSLGTTYWLHYQEYGSSGRLGLFLSCGSIFGENAFVDCSRSQTGIISVCPNRSSDVQYARCSLEWQE